MRAKTPVEAKIRKFECGRANSQEFRPRNKKKLRNRQEDREDRTLKISHLFQFRYFLTFFSLFRTFYLINYYLHSPNNEGLPIAIAAAAVLSAVEAKDTKRKLIRGAKTALFFHTTTQSSIPSRSWRQRSLPMRAMQKRQLMWTRQRQRRFDSRSAMVIRIAKLM